MSDFAARTPEEWALRAWIARKHDIEHVEIERIVSGEGLLNAFDHLVDASGGEHGELAAAVHASRTPGEVIVERSRGGDVLCMAALDLFLGALGAEAANLAARFQARGGVFIAGGGIAGKIPDLLMDGRVRRAYLRSARVAPIHAHVPLYLVPASGDSLGMEGASVHASSEGGRCSSRCELLQLPTAEDISVRVAALVIEALRETPDLVLCLATGATPTRCYAALAAEAERAPELFARLRIVQLDEWGGLSGGDPESCLAYIRQHAVGPLKVSADRFLSFDGTASDGAAECARVRLALERWGGINEPPATSSVADQLDSGLQRLGEHGTAGHGEALLRGAHVAKLSVESQGHQMVASRAAPTTGLTIGLAELCAASRCVVMVTGGHKATVLRAALRERVSARRPASLLRRFGEDVLFVADGAAAAEL